MKLDAFSKILIATGQINYMASSIEGLNSDYKVILSNLEIENKDIFQKSYDDRKSALESAVEKLRDVMNLLGDTLNNSDAVRAIDARISKVPFEIIQSDMDETDNPYYE